MNPALEEISIKIQKLQDLLLASDPKMPEHLRAIHRTLVQYEELSHLLSEDQIAIILEGAQKKLGMILADETRNSKSKTSSKLKGVTADDL